jgi:hypothetical protein
VTGRSISFVATPEGNIKDLTQDSSVLSLMIPDKTENCGRAGFCERSLFFWDAQAASSFLKTHPEAILLSIAEAAYVGMFVAQNRTSGASSDDGRRADVPEERVAQGGIESEQERVLQGEGDTRKGGL